MSLYYRDEARSCIGAHLVNQADFHKGGDGQEKRSFLGTVLAAETGAARFSSLMLELAAMEETAMPRTDKYALLGLLNQLPPADQEVRRSIRKMLKNEGIETIYENLKTSLRVGHPALRILERP